MSDAPAASPSLAANPALDSWLRIHRDGLISVLTGKVELGQKITLALAMVAAEELDVRLDRIRVLTADTMDRPDEGLTVGSRSMRDAGTAVRQAAARARSVMLTMAAAKLGRPNTELTIDDGVIRVGADGPSIDYWTLMGGRRFDTTVAGPAVPKPPGGRRLIGRSVGGHGFSGLACGTAAFVHDLRRPDMLHARPVRPPHPGARLLAVDAGAARAVAGDAVVVRDGDFLAVAAPREHGAIRAAERLKATARWDSGPPLAVADLFEMLRHNRRDSLPVIAGTPKAEPPPPLPPVPAEAAHTLAASYLRPYQMHAAIGPSAALAHWQDGGEGGESVLTLWCHSQGVMPLRAALCDLLGLPAARLRITHVPGAGCYGHNGADDAALDAALVARAIPGRPVLLQWSREDEHVWEPYGSAMLIELRASLDAAGRVIDWNHDGYSDTHNMRPVGPDAAARLLAARQIAAARPAPPVRPNMANHAGIHRNADPLYDFAPRRIVKHLVRDLPLRVSAMRSLGGYANIFAIESFMDELALAAGADPLDFRLAHLRDERAREVLAAAAGAAGWGRPPPSGTGRGIGFARYKNSECYAAVVMEASLDDYGTIALHRAIVAADAGEIVDPDGVTAQLEGGVVQAASWTLMEAVHHDESGVLSRDWDSYPIIRFDRVPEIRCTLLDRPGAPFLGAGEATQGPTAAAIANAVFAASGIRLRRLPFTAEQVRATAAGE